MLRTAQGQCFDLRAMGAPILGVGRDRMRNHIFIDDGLELSAISRSHAQLVVDPSSGRAALRDLRSCNGTFVVRPEAWAALPRELQRHPLRLRDGEAWPLRHGDLVSFGWPGMFDAASAAPYMVEFLEPGRQAAAAAAGGACACASASSETSSESASCHTCGAPGADRPVRPLGATFCGGCYRRLLDSGRDMVQERLSAGGVLGVLCGVRSCS